MKAENIEFICASCGQKTARADWRFVWYALGLPCCSVYCKKQYIATHERPIVTPLEGQGEVIP